MLCCCCSFILWIVLHIRDLNFIVISLFPPSLPSFLLFTSLPSVSFSVFFCVLMWLYVETWYPNRMRRVELRSISTSCSWWWKRPGPSTPLSQVVPIALTTPQMQVIFLFWLFQWGRRQTHLPTCHSHNHFPWNPLLSQYFPTQQMPFILVYNHSPQRSWRDLLKRNCILPLCYFKISKWLLLQLE